MVKKRKLHSPFALLVNKRCAELGINQAALAETMGISLNYLSLLKSGKRGKRLPLKKMQPFALALGVSVDALARSLDTSSFQISSSPAVSPKDPLSYTEKLLVKMSREIEVRKNAEEALLLSEARYKSILESMSEMVMRFTVPGKDLSAAEITYVNESFWDNVAVPQKTVLGSNPVDSFLKEHRKIFTRAVNNLSRKNPRASLEIIGNWSKRWRKISVTRINGNEFQIVAQDIHELKSSEIALSSLVAELKGLHGVVDKLGWCVCVVDTHYEILYSSKQFQELRGSGQGKCYAVFEKRDDICPNCPVRVTFKSGGNATLNLPAKIAGLKYTINSFPIKDKKGNIKGAITFLQPTEIRP